MQVQQPLLAVFLSSFVRGVSIDSGLSVDEVSVDIVLIIPLELDLFVCISVEITDIVDNVSLHLSSKLFTD